jgi:aldehyde:ferredoxin oxidoreductase
VYPEEIQKCSLNNRVSCFSCPVGCRHIASIREGLYKGTGEGLSYEVGWAFGSNCGVSRLDAIVYANWLCAEYGLDPVSCGATIACAMELADIGVVSQSEIGIDRPLRRGDAEAMVELTCLAGQARGFGKAIGKGSYRLAKAYSHPEFAMCCKKQEIPPFGIHVLRDFGLHIATSNDGGRYIVGYLMKNYLNGFSAERVKSMQDELALLESSGLCIFSNTVMETSRLVEHLSLATGIPFTETYGRLVGERIWNLERLYDLTGDFEGDTLPQQLMEEVSPMSDGTYFSTRFHAQLKQYYDARGWNGKGIPTKERKEILHL